MTPSFAPDLARCELLCESLRQCAPDATHYLLVDRHDVAKFRHLCSARTTIIESEDLIDRWLRPLPGGRGHWFSLRTWPVRGWILQQMLKIAAARTLSEDNLIYCDSDNVFVHPFDLSTFMIDGQLGLLDVDYSNAQIRMWTDVARNLLGIDKVGAPDRGHVGNLIAWRRDVVMRMTDRIEAVAHMPWQQAIARRRHLSEYTVYGVFVRELLGYDAARQTPSQQPLVKASWDTDLRNTATMDHFFGDLDPAAIAVMIHSKDGIDPARYRAHLERLWRAGA